MTSSVAFPQLGIGPFDLNRVAFSIGDFNVYWYAIIITFGMILAILFAMKFAKRYQLSSDDLLDVVLWCIPTALIGARIYYVLFSIQDFLTDGKLDWGKVFAFRNGGLLTSFFLVVDIYLRSRIFPYQNNCKPGTQPLAF